MKKFILAFALMLCTVSAWAQNTPVLLCEAAATSCSPFAFTPKFGDVLLYESYRGTSATASGATTGYTSLTTQTGNTNAMRASLRYSLGNETSSGTSANATAVRVIDLGQGWLGANYALGPNYGETTENASTAISYPGFTINTLSFGTSQVMCLGGSNGGSINTAPTGLTYLTGTALTNLAFSYSAGYLTSWSTTAGPNPSAVNASICFEFTDAPSMTALPLSTTLIYDIQPGVSSESMTTPYTFTMSIPPTSNNGTLEVAWFWNYASEPTVSNVYLNSDTGHSTWTPTQIESIADTSDGTDGFIYLIPTSTTSATSVSIVASGATTDFYPRITLYAGQWAKDVVAAQHTSYSVLWTPGALAVTQSGDIVNVDCTAASMAHLSGAAYTDVYAPEPSTMLEAYTGHSIASDGFIYNSTTSISPYLYAFGYPSGNNYECVAAALKNTGSGTMPSGWRMVYLTDLNVSYGSNANIYEFQQFAAGDQGLWHVDAAQVASTPQWSGISDTQGSSYTSHHTDDGSFSYPDWGVDCDLPGGLGNLTFTGLPGGITANMVYQEFYGLSNSNHTACDPSNVAKGNTSGASTVSNMPTITPTSTNSAIIASSEMGTGTPSSVSAPTGAVFGVGLYYGQTDTSSMNLGNMLGTYVNTAVTALHFGWVNCTITGSSCASTTWQASAIELTAPAFAQTYNLPNTDSGCPSTCRQIPWVDGSDIWNSGSLPVYSQVTCTPLHEDGSTDDTSDINACITAANAGTGSYSTCHAAGGCAVYLPAGIVYINGTVQLASKVVLRGAKAEGAPPYMPVADAAATTIKLGSSEQITNTNFSYDGGGLYPSTAYGSFPSTYCSLSGTPTKGDTTVTINSSGSCTVSVGMWIIIYGNDDPTLIYATGTDGHCDWCGSSIGFYIQQQIVQVTAINSGSGGAGSNVSISKPLYYTLDVNSETVPGFGGSGTKTEPAGAKYQIVNFVTTQAGFENLRFDGSAYDIGATQIILLQGCLYCWVKNVETYDTGSSSGSAHVEMDYTYGNEVRDSAFHDQRSGASGAGYGVYFQFTNSDAKIENNILWHNRHWIVYQGGGSGTAILFNYADDDYTDDLTYLGSGRTSHGAHPYFNLFEGNIASILAADDFWGTSSHDVMFRNWFRGGEPNTIYPSGSGIGSFPPNSGFDAVDLFQSQEYYSYVDNVLGNPGLGSGISGTWSAATVSAGCTTNSCGYDPPGTPVVYQYGSQTLVSTLATSQASIIRQGNYDYKTLGVAYNDGGTCGGTCTYANSLYYASKPSFMGTCAWPAQGGDLSVKGSLQQPAYQRAVGGSCTGSSTPATPTLMSTLF